MRRIEITAALVQLFCDVINNFIRMHHSTVSLPTVFPPAAADGWELVGSLDMLDYQHQKCPNQWRSYITKKACGRIPGQLCSSLIVPTGSSSFRQVCGRIRAFQFGSPDAFAALFVAKPVSIDGPYVDGISITYNNGGQRQHVFTYAAGLMEQYNPSIYPQSTCPCAGGTQIPPFVRTADYYCESGNPDKTWYANQLFCDPLWDGEECRYAEETCCHAPHQPWFCKDLGKRVSSDLEIRLCADEGVVNEDIAVEAYEFYVR